MNIGIIGTGAYAIALASILENYHQITMWTKLENEYLELKKNYTNKKVLNYKLNKKIEFTMDIKEAILNKDIVILAIPAIFVKDTILDMKPYVTTQTILIATKGLEKYTNSFINEFIQESCKTTHIACISGPSFAKDIIKKEPFALTLASKNKKSLDLCYQMFLPVTYLKLDVIKDILGCELCGILKNIIAILAGILEGMNLNPSTKAKFFVEASKEMQRIIKELGGEWDTFFTYAGLGDLVLTATSTDSRNYTFGLLIGSNGNFHDYQKKTTIEGLENLVTMNQILNDKNIYSPIIDILFKIVYLQESKDLILDYLKK